MLSAVVTTLSTARAASLLPQVKPNNKTVQAPSSFLRRSHQTLLMFRKEGRRLPVTPNFRMV